MGKKMKVKAKTMLCRRQFKSPSTTDLRESLTPYRKNSSTMAALVSPSKNAMPPPWQGMTSPSTRLMRIPVVKASK